MENKLRVIGFVPDRESIEQDIAIEDLKYWAKQPVVEMTYDYRPQKLVLSEAAKHAFARGIYYVNLLRKI